ncbi:MAG TPA: hypothetical protein VLI90_20140 [Tepidisphaeraceae bacterium]|nr:hypothetical protein [Tepidisphaeraceae bacterium]
MPETFLILLSAGVMFAAAVPRPLDVTLRWLRLAGMIALSLTALSLFLWLRRGEIGSANQGALYLAVAVLILGQLAMTQTARANAQRVFALLATVAGVALAVRLLSSASWKIALSCAGVAVMCGVALMDMLLGHAYLTASKMTMRPFHRLNDTLGITAVIRLIVATAGVLWLNSRSPVPMLWGVYGLYMITRWLVGLAVPLVFVYMARDCIARRSTQSATGILYVAGVLIFIGEILALNLARETGLPF